MEDLDTELLGQLQRWHEEDQYQRIIDAIEAIPQRSGAMSSPASTSTTTWGEAGPAPL